jgi:hypothetical protein
MNRKNISIIIFVVIILLCTSCYFILKIGLPRLTASKKPSDYIAFSGQVIDPNTKEWNNNRLVLLFLQGEEIARTKTSLRKVAGNDLGATDGAFFIEANNKYQLSQYLLYSENLKYDFKQERRWRWPLGRNNTIVYYWLGQIGEGDTIRIPIKSKKIEYVLKILEGDISSLPSEILQKGSTRLLEDGRIVVALPGSVATEGTQTSGIFVQDISYATRIEQIVTNKLTVPINNCAGSVEVSQKYTQTQTFVHQYTSEIGFSIGIEIPLPLWSKLTPEFQAKYGFENGQIDSRSIEYNMAAAPGTNVIYIITWSEIWESGAANVINGNDTIIVPFRVKTGLMYGVSSEPGTCP